MEVRQITREEVPEFIRLLQYSFGKYTEEPIEEERVEAQRLEGSFAVFEEGQIVSQIVVHAFSQAVRGAVLGMGGIGGVGTLPEYRGRGLVRALLSHSFGWMRENGLAVSMLRPFKEAYYEKFGYVRTSHGLRVEIPNSTFASYGRKMPAGVTVERLAASGKRDRYFRAIQSFSRLLHGRVVDERIGDKGFKGRFKDRLLVVASQGEQPVAMFTYRKEGFGNDGVLTLQDLIFDGTTGRDALFAFLALHQDQIGRVSLLLPYDANFTALFPRVQEPVKLEYLAAPWMVRIVDFPAALTGLPVPGAREEGEQLRLRVNDELCRWNQGSYTLTAHDGRLAISESSEEPELSCSITALSALLYGSFGVDQVFEEFPGHAPPDVRLRLSRWFPPRALFNDYWF